MRLALDDGPEAQLELVARLVRPVERRAGRKRRSTGWPGRRGPFDRVGHGQSRIGEREGVRGAAARRRHPVTLSAGVAPDADVLRVGRVDARIDVGEGYVGKPADANPVRHRRRNGNSAGRGCPGRLPCVAALAGVSPANAASAAAEVSRLRRIEKSPPKEFIRNGCICPTR